MASFETLQDRLAALQETTAQLQTLIERLATIKFEPGSVPLSASISSLTSDVQDDEEPNVASELSGEISQILREEEEEVELLREEVDDMTTGKPGSEEDHQKRRLKEGLARLESVLKESRISFRKAQLSARRNIQEAQKLERQALLASYTASVLTTSPNPSQPSPDPNNSSETSPKPLHTELFSARDRRRMREKEKSGARDVVATSSNVTDALRRTHTLIAGELAKSAFAQQTLAESTAALKELQQTYDGIDGMLAKSRDLVGALMTSQKSDTWYLRTSFYMLLCTLAWLIFRRVLYGPLWWIVWFPVRTTFRTGKAVSNLASGGADSGASMAVMDSAGKTTVVGIGEEGAVPTAQVGDAGAQDAKGDSLVDEFGQMIEDSIKGKVPDEVEETIRNASEEAAEEVQPNPKKRMWEEPAADAEGERVRDEL